MKKLLLLSFFTFTSLFLFGQTVITVFDDDITAGENVTWTKDNIYLLDGYVFVEEGATLNIEPGTVIKGKETPTTGDNASALIITRNATINAVGTAEEPIIFTAEIDDTNDPFDLSATDRGLWGGLIVLGNGVIANPTSETNIEGIPTNEVRALFGGNDDNDNSGNISYISIRHGGAELSPGNEINGFTLGAVGSATQIDHVEVIANADDGIEFFGGTANMSYVSVSFCGDDAIDWDLGYRGKLQFAFVMIGEDEGDNGGELDGAKPDDGEPFANPTVYNATFIGSGIGATAKNATGLLFRDGTGGQIWNSIITEFSGKGIEVEDRASGLDSRQRMADGQLALANNIWWDFGAGNELNAGANGFIRATDDAEDPMAQFLIDHLVNNSNTIENPLLRGIDRIGANGLDPRPEFGGPAYQNVAEPTDSYFKNVPYKGAFGGTIWLAEWTALEEYGFLTDAGPNKITIKDEDLKAGQTYTWTADNCYLLDGYVFLEDGGTLNIEPGTIIKGKEVPSTGDNASALIITRGATLNAVGTAQEPIIFTAEIDDTDDPYDLAATDRGLWGGLIMLGKAEIANPTSETNIEGIPVGEDRALFGGDDDEDNSGKVSYVSIRHGGAELSPGNEINGFTLGAVGSGTEIDHVEVIANADDGIEFFGGTVAMKYVSVTFCGDDAIDWDLGYRGKLQHVFVMIGEDDGDNGGELDGAKPDDGEPFANPTVYNATFIGSGIGATAKNATGLLFRDGTGGQIWNSIITEFTGKGIEVEDRASGVDSRQRMENGQLALANNIWWEFGAGNELNAGANGFIRATDDAEDPNAQFLIDHLATNDNTIEDPELGGVDRFGINELDPRPRFGGPAYQNVAEPTDMFFDATDYKGAFGSTLWLSEWTALDEYDFLAATTKGCQNEVIVRDGDLNGGETYNWTNDNCYLLDGFVFLEEGGTLNIQAGTVIRGKETTSTGDNASALIITRGATINAVGTEDQPIIFTAEIDDVEDPFDLTAVDRGLWGGLIILGEAVIANPTAETNIEGIPVGEDRALFGGDNDEDNSGRLSYVSIRHGGAELSPGNEINGLTMGAVGSGTQLDHIEVIANADDGIEFFGGTVNLKYAAVSFCGDDAIDWDLGYRGKAQFVFTLVGDDEGDNCGELDGAKPDDGEPTSQPYFANVTFIGSGIGATAKNATGLLFRDGTGGHIWNSILTDMAADGIEVEDRASGLDSRQRMENGELTLKNNIWWNFGSGNELNAGPNGFIRATDDAEDPTAQFLIDHLANNGNTVEDPELGGISRVEDGGLNPFPAENGPAYRDLANNPMDAFFENVGFKGAFGGIKGERNWLNVWSALHQYGILNGTLSSDRNFAEEVAENSLQVRPNPLRDYAEIRFILNANTPVNLRVYDMNGKMVASILNGEEMTAGEHFVPFAAGNLTNGVYVYQLITNSGIISETLMIQK